MTINISGFYVDFCIPLVKKILPFLCFGILFAAVYDLLHPNSNPDIMTGVTCVSAVVLCSILLWFFRRVKQKPVFYDLLFITAAGLILRILSVSTIHNEQVSDFQIYHELGVALSEGKGYTYTGKTGLGEDLLLYLNKEPRDEPVVTALRSPGMPFLLAGVYYIFGKKPVFGKILNIFLGVCCGLCIYLLIHPFDPRFSFTGGFLWMIYPPVVLSTNILGTEIPFTLAVLLFALALNKIFKGYKLSRTLMWVFLSGLSAGIATLFRPAVYLLPVSLFVLILFKGSLKEKLVIIILFVLSFYMPQTIWGLRNYKTFRVFHGQATNIGACMELRTRYLSPQREALLDSLKTVKKQTADEFEIDKITQKIALKRVELAFKDGSIFKIIIKNFIKTWKHDRDPLEWSSISSFFFTQRPSVEPMDKRLRKYLEILINISYLTLILCACLGSLALNALFIQRNMGFLFLVFNLYTVTILLCIFTGEPRFHYTVLTTLLILASCGIINFSEFFKKKCKFFPQ